MDNQTYQIIRARIGGPQRARVRLLEPVYQQALDLEVCDRQKEICVVRLRLKIPTTFAPLIRR
jgi:hypothetical protein